MPYLRQSQRDSADNSIRTPGDLNFWIHELLDEFYRQNGESYATHNAAVGALECAKAELLRRGVGPYEDRKIAENGDVTLYLRLSGKLVEGVETQPVGEQAEPTDYR